MTTEYNVNDSSYDKLVDEFMSGKLSKEDAERMMNDKLSIQREIKKGKSLDELDSELKYNPTESTLRYCLYGNKIIIAKAKSDIKDQGGFSILLSQLEEIAIQNEVPFLGLDVWAENINAKEIYEHKGFYETNRTYDKKEKDFLISMQKDLE